MSTQAKPAWQSRTVIGVFIMMVASIASEFGVEINQSEVLNIVYTAVELIGAGIALYGRAVASQPVKWK